MLNRGDWGRDHGLSGRAVSHDVCERLHIGAKFYGEGADQGGARATAQFNLGVVYDLNTHYHLILSAGPQKASGARAESNL